MLRIAVIIENYSTVGNDHMTSAESGFWFDKQGVETGVRIGFQKSGGENMART